MQITKMLVPESKYNIKCPHEMTPEFIVIHNTANDASAMAEISYMIGNNNKVSFHCAIDNTRIVQGVPFDRNTWNEKEYLLKSVILNLEEKTLKKQKD